MAAKKVKTAFKPAPSSHEDENGVWLSIKAYGEKYGIPRSRVYALKRAGKVVCQQAKFSAPVYILDVPLAQQPVGEDRNKIIATTPSTPKTHAELDAKRKKKLAEKYLPIFIEKASPDKMVFSGKDLVDMFGISPMTLYRDWMKWGLVAREIPYEYRSLSDQRLSGKNYYYRRDVYRFLSGDWEPIEKGSADDILIGAAEDRKALIGKYWEYDKAKAYPIDGNGFLAWVKDMGIKRKDNRTGGWVPLELFEPQREFAKRGLALTSKGGYKHNLLVYSTPRGEGKTLLVALIAVFRFFNSYGEIINLSGNSKDQSTFAHYDLIKGIIQNNPKLNSTPGLEIKEKYIALMGGPKEPINQIKAIPTSTGLLPGTTCAVFTELHNLEDRKFFIDLWTSTRATPNAMVLVDTTVAAPGHIVYELWESYQRGEDPLLYFHHYADKHYNPEITPEQLNSFRRHMLESEFNRYFRNRWEDATGGLFNAQSIKKLRYCGVKGDPRNQAEMSNIVRQIVDAESRRNTFRKGKVSLSAINKEISDLEAGLIDVETIYKIPATTKDIENLGKVMGANLIIGVGLDRAQMLGEASDRTVLTCVARVIVSAEVSYYFVLDVLLPRDSSLSTLSEKISEWAMLYGWIDKIVVESYLGLDVYNWCLERGYETELLPATYKNQKAAFTELYKLVEHGYLKIPRVPYYTDEDGNLYHGLTGQDDILRQEMRLFSHSSHSGNRGWFGSPEKKQRGGVKDDAVYSLAWGVYATQGEMVPIGMRGAAGGVGTHVANTDVLGDYRRE